MDTQSTYVSQSALYGAAGGAEDEGGEAKTTAANLQASRSFFIIDKSRMVGERDTVEDAKVVYLPESEFNRVRYHTASMAIGRGRRHPVCRIPLSYYVVT